MNAEFLLETLAANPNTEAVDAVKWLFQSAFGCGHLLPQEHLCAAGIHEEMAQVHPNEATPPYHLLANGLCRLNLASPAVRVLPPTRIARMMQATQRHIPASVEFYEQSLTLLYALTAQHGADSPAPRLSFTFAALKACLDARKADPYAPPRHSARYRKACRPAYRVVLRRYGEALPLMQAVEAQLAAKGRATLVLDGDCAAGKTTLAALLAALYDCNVFHMDDFFLPYALRTPQRLQTPGGNVHYERFLTQVLTSLAHNAPIRYEAFDCHTGDSRPLQVMPKPVTIIEGSYALHPAFDAVYDKLSAIRALLQVDAPEQEKRILRRNGAAMLTRFQNEWIPLEKHYLEAYHKTRADAMILRSAPHIADEA